MPGLAVAWSYPSECNQSRTEGTRILRVTGQEWALQSRLWQNSSSTGRSQDAKGPTPTELIRIEKRCAKVEMGQSKCCPTRKAWILTLKTATATWANQDIPWFSAKGESPGVESRGWTWWSQNDWRTVPVMIGPNGWNQVPTKANQNVQDFGETGITLGASHPTQRPNHLTLQSPKKRQRTQCRRTFEETAGSPNEGSPRPEEPDQVVQEIWWKEGYRDVRNLLQTKPSPVRPCCVKEGMTPKLHSPGLMGRNQLRPHQPQKPRMPCEQMTSVTGSYPGAKDPALA